MAGYDLDEYEDYYEDEGGEYEEEGGEYEEEEEEEEERAPTQDELEYLELRQKLKDAHRKNLKKETGSRNTNSQEKKTKNIFGTFFGPSQPVIAPRVIQESKSLLENPRLAESFTKSKNVQSNGGSSNPGVSKPRPNGNQQQPRKVDKLAKPKAKIEMLKNTRDYSFLLSDDAELPVPPKNPPPKYVPTRIPAEEARSERHPNNIGRNVSNGREERKPMVTSGEMRSKAGQKDQRPSTSSKLPSTSQDYRKQVARNGGSGPGRPLPSHDSRKQAGRNEGSGPGRPSASNDSRKQTGRNEGSGPGRPLASHDPRKQVSRKEGSGPGRPVTSQDSRKQVGRDERSGLSRPSGQKPVPSKMAAVNRQRVTEPLVSRGSIPTGHKPNTSRPPPATHKRPLDHKRDERGSSNGNMIRKPMAMSRPQIKQQQARPPSSGQQKERQQKRPARPFDDEDEDAFSILRKMTRYNPSKYRGVNDDSDSDMEANFEDIQREEKRSARIAREEDEEEAKKLEEEEKRERMRREAKRRKL